MFRSSCRVRVFHDGQSDKALHSRSVQKWHHIWYQIWYQIKHDIMRFKTDQNGVTHDPTGLACFGGFTFISLRGCENFIFGQDGDTCGVVTSTARLLRLPRRSKNMVASGHPRKKRRWIRFTWPAWANEEPRSEHLVYVFGIRSTPSQAWTSLI